MEKQINRSISDAFDTPEFSNSCVEVYINTLKEKQEGLKPRNFEGEYEGKGLKRILFSLPKATQEIYLVAEDRRDLRTNLVRLSPKMFKVSSSNFSRDIKPLMTNKILLKQINCPVIGKDVKRIITFMFNPYFIIPMKDIRDKSNGYGRIFEVWNELNKVC